MAKEVYNYPNRHFIADFWRFVRPYRFKFLLWSSIRLLVTLTMLAIPILLGKIIDTLSSPPFNAVHVWTMVGAIAIIHLTTPSIRLLSKYHLGRVKDGVSRDVRLAGLAKILELDLSWHEERMTGQVMQRVSAGADAMGAIVDFLRQDGIDVVANLFGAVLVFAYLDLTYCAILLISIAAYWYCDYRGNLLAAQERNRQSSAREQVSGKTYEFASNIHTVKSMGLDKKLLKDAGKAESTLYEIARKLYIIKNRKWRVMQTLAGVFQSILIALVTRDVIKGNLTVGSIIVYVSYFQKVHDSISKVSISLDELINNKNRIYRLMLVLDEHSEIESGKALRTVASLQRIELDHVDFSYKDKPVLSRVTFAIDRGDRVGIVGQSGVGKSTLFKLLLKLYQPTGGDIRINGLPIDSIKRESITTHLTIVPQETEVFNLSFKENVCISSSKGSINEALYRRALRVSACDDIVSKLPELDNTLIGEKGVRLSGGEKQRLGIARAIYKNADVILLDESTSHLDSRTEQKILGAIDSELHGKTLIVIAHRLSTLKGMDRVLVFSQGSLVEQGTYRSLLAKKGVLYGMHRLQGT